MTAATEKELSALHKKVAAAMIKALDRDERATFLLERFADEVPDEVAEFLEECTNINPALLQAITKFLRDNDISAEVDASTELNGLQHRLANKTRRSVGNVTAIYEPDE